MAFEFGKTSSLLSQSIAHHEDEGHNDYERYYVNMCVYCTSIYYDHTNILGGPGFVDCDMFMCFCGLGPGHQATCTITKVFRDEVRLVFDIACEDEGETTVLEMNVSRDCQSMRRNGSVICDSATRHMHEAILYLPVICDYYRLARVVNVG